MDDKTLETIAQWRGAEVVDRDGEKIGKLEEIYLDHHSDEPEWALVKTGLFGGRGHFVPLKGAEPEGDAMRVAFEKQLVESAPGIDPDGELTPAEEVELFKHYTLDYGEGDSGSSAGGGLERDRGGDLDRERGGDPDRERGGEMDRERGGDDRTAGGTRLRRYLVTEEVRDGEVQGTHKEQLGER